MSGILNSTGAVSGVIGTTEAPSIGTATDGYVFTATGAGVDPAWEAVVSAANTPAFEASLSANSTGSDNTELQLPCNTETFDVGGCYNNTGSTVTLNGISTPAYAFAPNVAGKYLIHATAQGECGIGTLAEGMLIIEKDGTYVKSCRAVDDDGRSRDTQTTYALVVMNGSSNYVQAFYKVDVSTGGGWTLETASPAGTGTTFGGFRVIE